MSYIFQKCCFTCLASMFWKLYYENMRERSKYKGGSPKAKDFHFVSMLISIELRYY